MRELDCDFCGGTAAGAYEILPDEVDPAPGEQVRVVLCGDCRETLDDVLAPLLDRLGARDDGGVDHSFADATAGHAPSDPSPTEDAIDETGADRDLATDAAAPERTEPDSFRKVMRFLNNREFPVDRAEVSEFAAGAYGLEDDEVREIFDYAIERGILAEENGQLVKG
ncbi:hypothetical protein [Halobaculum marinum]|uniref:Uncharacterized protein n=1 Tax=Halobaculum marinum TaxID=3031996 RepID=A0ABD5X2F1_9EURY|nr:hypothetical protein [Halobaculum sp. DT55]